MDALGTRIERELLAWAETDFPDRRSAVLALRVFAPETDAAKARVAAVIEELAIDPEDLRAYLEHYPPSQAAVAKVERRLNALVAVPNVKRRFDELDVDDGYPNMYFGEAIRLTMLEAGATKLLSQLPPPRLPSMFRSWAQVEDRRSLEALLSRDANRTRPVVLYVRHSDASAGRTLDTVLQATQVQDLLAEFVLVVIDATEDPDAFAYGLHNVWRGPAPRLFVYDRGQDVLEDIASDHGAGPYYRWRGTSDVPSSAVLAKALRAVLQRAGGG